MLPSHEKYMVVTTNFKSSISSTVSSVLSRFVVDGKFLFDDVDGLFDWCVSEKRYHIMIVQGVILSAASLVWPIPSNSLCDMESCKQIRNRSRPPSGIRWQLHFQRCQLPSVETVNISRYFGWVLEQPTSLVTNQMKLFQDLIDWFITYLLSNYKYNIK